MLQKESRFHVADNSGAEVVCCFGLPGGSRKRYASVGDIVIVSVKKARTGGGIKKGQVVKAVIVRQRRNKRRGDGTQVKFDDNACVIVNNKGEPEGTRVFGPVAREVREKGYVKICSLAPEVV